MLIIHLFISIAITGKNGKTRYFRMKKLRLISSDMRKRALRSIHRKLEQKKKQRQNNRYIDSTGPFGTDCYMFIDYDCYTVDNKCDSNQVVNNQIYTDGNNKGLKQRPVLMDSTAENNDDGGQNNSAAVETALYSGDDNNADIGTQDNPNLFGDTVGNGYSPYYDVNNRCKPDSHNKTSQHYPMFMASCTENKDERKQYNSIVGETAHHSGNDNYFNNQCSTYNPTKGSQDSPYIIRDAAGNGYNTYYGANNRYYVDSSNRMSQPYPMDMGSHIENRNQGGQYNSTVAQTGYYTGNDNYNQYYSYNAGEGSQQASNTLGGTQGNCYDTFSGVNDGCYANSENTGLQQSSMVMDSCTKNKDEGRQYNSTVVETAHYSGYNNHFDNHSNELNAVEGSWNNPMVNVMDSFTKNNDEGGQHNSTVVETAHYSSNNNHFNNAVVEVSWNDPMFNVRDSCTKNKVEGEQCNSSAVETAHYSGNNNHFNNHCNEPNTDEGSQDNPIIIGDEGSQNNPIVICDNDNEDNECGISNKVIDNDYCDIDICSECYEQWCCY